MILQGGYEGASFFELLQQTQPHLLPFHQLTPTPARAANVMESAPFATTVLALRFANGVIMAGDRQGTEGFEVASHGKSLQYSHDFCR